MSSNMSGPQAHGHDDFDFEPVRGLPKALPPGETILWQGAPDFDAVLRRVFHARKLGLYFGVLAVWSAASSIADDVPLGEALLPLGALALAALAATALVALLAWGIAKTTVYTLTQRRIVMRIGIALPITFNIPFKRIERAAVKANGDGTGDIVMTLAPGDRLAYLVMWPHARPWHFGRVEPSLRAIADVEAVAQLFARAVVGEPGSAALGTPVRDASPVAHATPDALGVGGLRGSAA
jgi:hypothetical protein